MTDLVEARQVMARNVDIQECKRQVKFWTEKLKRLERERRRETFLPRCKEDPRAVWKKLSHEERCDKDFVLAALSSNSDFFSGKDWSWSSFPALDGWRRTRCGRWREPIHVSLLSDRDVVLAFVAEKNFEQHFRNMTFVVPEQLRDDREVMYAVCCKNWNAFLFASPRLQDDRDLVIAACNKNLKALEFASTSMRDDRDLVIKAIKKGSHCPTLGLKYASDRLKRDKMVLIAGVERSPIDFSWLKNTHVAEAADEKEIALAAIKRLSEIGNEWTVSPLQYFSEIVRDDKELVLDFVQVHGESLEFCSIKLKNDREVARAAVLQSPNALRYCSDQVHPEILSDEEFLLSAIAQGGGRLLNLAPSDMQKRKTVVLTALANGLLYSDVPKCMKADPEIILAALAGDAAEADEIPKSVLTDTSFVMDAIKINPDIYEHLPDSLRQDEAIALEVLKSLANSDFCYEDLPFVLEDHPSLQNQKEAMMAVAATEFCDSDLFFDLVPQCRALLDDKDFILAACAVSPYALEYASERLKGDRDVILSMFPSHPLHMLTEATNQFQVNNIDLVVKAIQTAKDAHVEELLGLSPDVFRDGDVVRACLDRGWPILKRLVSPLVDNHEIIKLAVKNDWSEFMFAPAKLKSDRDFVLSLVNIDGRALSLAEGAFLRDDEILIAAIANNYNVIDTCFDEGSDDDFLVSFAKRVRVRLFAHDAFVQEFLRGISVPRPHVAPANRCRLPLLDRGLETSTAFKSLIAEYSGVPVGRELRLLRAASSNLIKSGF